MSEPRKTTPRGRTPSTRRTKRPEAFEAWIESAIAYVPSVARRYLGCGLPFDELLAAGNLGLVEAGLRFDPSRDVKFVTYADWWIRKTILKAIQEQSGAVRLPRYRIERIRMLQDTRADLRKRNGTDPSIEQIADASGVSPRDVRSLFASGQNAVSLDQPVTRDASRSLVETLRAEVDDGHPDAVMDENYLAHVRTAVAGLDSRERLILSLRFGFLDDEPLTLREAGRRLGLSRERVRQIERRALGRLRDRLRPD